MAYLFGFTFCRVPRVPVLDLGLLNYHPSTRACSFTRRPHFQALSSRIFFNFPLRSNANKKVIDTHCTSMLLSLCCASDKDTHPERTSGAEGIFSAACTH